VTAAKSFPQEISLQVGLRKPAAADPVPETVPDTPFVRDLVGLLRAGDSYGRLDRFSDAALLRPFVLNQTARAAISVDCEVDAVVIERVRSFYQAAAAGVERATHVMTSVVIDISHEGFGRVAVVAGRLIALMDPLRDIQRFGFPSLDALAAAGEQLVARGVAAIDTYPGVAGEDV